jgi:leucyl aminopeptidase
MEFKISTTQTKKSNIYIINEIAQLKSIEELNAAEIAYAETCIKSEQNIISINKYGRFAYVYFLKTKTTTWQNRESLRKAGSTFSDLLQKEKAITVQICNKSKEQHAAYSLAEGLALSSYQFLKYRNDAKKKINSLKNIEFDKLSITVKDLNQLRIVCDAVAKARTLVNEPLSFLSAEQLAKEIATMGKVAGFKVTTLRKAQIVKEKMGGILAVNRGSIDPPTFSVMEYKPTKSLNKQPIVLVGKGIVYDTGGLSLKPTPNSMDRMKSDMSGAALVSAAMFAIAQLNLPLHIIALVPATDNRPGENAYVPGDVVSMYDGTTVEVLNTDAEGRMVLADALHWAKRYKPELVIDFATLTGAAAAITGDQAMVYMGTAEDKIKMAFEESGRNQYERMVAMPLWDEYGELIKSDIADLKNVGGPYGGAITAGKFLEHFTAYPWLHFDIAGVSFATSKKGYYTNGGTAFGLRMLLDYLINYGK